MNEKQIKIIDDLNNIKTTTYGEQCDKEERIEAAQKANDAYNKMVKSVLNIK